MNIRKAITYDLLVYIRNTTTLVKALCNISFKILVSYANKKYKIGVV